MIRSHRRPRLVVMLVLVAMSALALTSPTLGSAAPRAAAPRAAVPTAQLGCFFAKTRFVLHAGAAIGVFHRYLYKPFQAGTFKSGAPGQKTAIVKAAIAGAFIYHEVKKANDFIPCSKTLSTLASPFKALGATLSTFVTDLKAGNFSDVNMGSLAGSFDGIAAAASKLGIPIKELTPPVPGA